MTDFTPATPDTSSPVVYVFEVNTDDDHHYRSLFEWYGEHDQFENYTYDISSTLSNKVQGKKYLFKQARIVTASLHHAMSSFRLQAQLQGSHRRLLRDHQGPGGRGETIGFATALPRRSDDGAVLQNETVNVTFPAVTVDTGFDIRDMADGPCIVHLRTPDGRDWQAPDEQGATDRPGGRGDECVVRQRRLRLQDRRGRSSAELPARPPVEQPPVDRLRADRQPHRQRHVRGRDGHGRTRPADARTRRPTMR